MLKQALILALVTFIPFFELRFSIPLGFLSCNVNLPFGLSASGFGMHWLSVFLICVIANMILGIIIFWALMIFVKYFVHYKFFRAPYNFFVKRTQKRIHKWVDRYGFWGVALFISVPLPGSGSYSGALGSHIIGLSFKRFILANCVGVTLAGIFVLLLSFAFEHIFCVA